MWGEIDTIRAPLYTIPFSFTDPGPDNNLATAGDDQTIDTFDRPRAAVRIASTPTSADNNADFHTIEFALNRRFANNWMVLTSFGYTWSTMLHEVTGYQRLTGQADATANQNYLPVRRLFGDNGNETSTSGTTRRSAATSFPWEIGFSGSWKLQSGQNYGRTYQRSTSPATVSRTFRVEPVDSQPRSRTSRSSTSGSTRAFRFGKFGRLTGQFDIFNLLNSGVPTNFRQTRRTYLEVIEHAGAARHALRRALRLLGLRAYRRPRLAWRARGRHRRGRITSVVRPFFWMNRPRSSVGDNL